MDDIQTSVDKIFSILEALDPHSHSEMKISKLLRNSRGGESTWCVCLITSKGQSSPKHGKSIQEALTQILDKLSAEAVSAMQKADDLRNALRFATHK